MRESRYTTSVQPIIRQISEADTKGETMKDHSTLLYVETLTIAAFAFLLMTATAASAQVRTEIPTEDPGPPFYARFERDAVHTDIVPHTDEWAAVVFYRSPGCIPVNFNLLDLFDVPGAFFCDLTIDGFEVWRNGPPPIDQAPMMAVLRGMGAVPIWFVSWEELQAEIADDALTITELSAMKSLIVGTATDFHETLHPTGGAVNPKILINARGTLEDGRSFRLTHSGQKGGITTNINFK